MKMHPSLTICMFVAPFLFLFLRLFIYKILLIRKSNRSQLDRGQEVRITTGIVRDFSLSASLNPGEIDPEGRLQINISLSLCLSLCIVAFFFFLLSEMVC